MITMACLFVAGLIIGWLACAPLSRGAQLAVLRALTEGEATGRELVALAAQRGWALTGVYVTLAHLAQRGAVASRDVPSPHAARGAFPQRMYSITPAGADMLAKERD